MACWEAGFPQPVRNVERARMDRKRFKCLLLNGLSVDMEEFF